MWDWGLGVLSPALPAPLSTTLSLALSVYLCECGATGSASGQTACPVCPTLCQSWSLLGNASPVRPGCPSLPLLPVWMNVYFLFPWCRTSLPLDFLSVLVVRGGAVCLPTPPSWFLSHTLTLNRLFSIKQETPKFNCKFVSKITIVNYLCYDEIMCDICFLLNYSII